MLTSLFTISLGAILVNNFIFSQFLGICPFMGVSKKMDTALGMGFAVIFVMGVASAVTWAVNEFFLVPFDLVYMQTIAFILVIASLVQFIEMFLQKTIPSLYQALGIYLPLITTNCAILGVTLLNIQNQYDYLHALVNALGAGLGFMLAMVLFSGVRQRIGGNDVPKAFQGLPITLISAAIVAMSFLGFGGVIDGIFG